MQIKVNGKPYTIEFTFEAAESEVVCKAYDFFSGAYMLKAMPELANAQGNKDFEVTNEMKIKQLDAMTQEASKAPKLAIDFLFMGLQEYHADEIQTRDNAKALYKAYCKENPDTELSYNIGLFEALKGQMETDGFFKRIGVDAMMETPKEVKQPQDHKKKSDTKA